MNKKLVWKYVLPKGFVDAKLDLPEGRIIHVERTSNNVIVLWLEILVPNDWDGRTPVTQENFFRRIPTGAFVPERYHHFYSWVDDEGFVWHLYRYHD